MDKFLANLTLEMVSGNALKQREHTLKDDDTYFNQNMLASKIESLNRFGKY